MTVPYGSYLFHLHLTVLTCKYHFLFLSLQASHFIFFVMFFLVFRLKSLANCYNNFQTSWQPQELFTHDCNTIILIGIGRKQIFIGD